MTLETSTAVDSFEAFSGLPRDLSIEPAKEVLTAVQEEEEGYDYSALTGASTEYVGKALRELEALLQSEQEPIKEETGATKEVNLALCPKDITQEEFLSGIDDISSGEGALLFRYRMLNEYILARQKNDDNVITSTIEGGIEKIDLVRLGIANNLRVGIEDFSSDSFLVHFREKQQPLYRAVVDFIEADEFSGWGKASTGVGKTALFSVIAAKAGWKTLVVVPKKNLIKQAVDELIRFSNGTLTCGRYFSLEHDLTKHVTVSSYQSLPRLVREAKQNNLTFPLVVCDEYHRAFGRKRKKALKELPGVACQLGFTATPAFNEEKNLYSLGKPIFEISIRDAIKSSLTAGARIILAKTKVNISEVQTTEDFSTEELGRSVNIPVRNRAVISLLKEPVIGEKTTAISCVNQAHCEELARLANEAGLKADFVHSGVPDEENQKRRQALADGEIQFLFFVDQLTEGWDCPRAEVLVNAAPTLSVVKAEQRGGRVTRKYISPEGIEKKYGIIIEILDEGVRPVLMSDILGGVYLYPPSSEGSIRDEEKKDDDEFEHFHADIEGLEVLFDIKEIAKSIQERDREVSGEEQTHREPLSEEYIRSLILRSNLTQKQRTTNKYFFGHHFDSPEFSGSGRMLVKRFYEDHRGVEYPSTEINRNLLFEMLKGLNLVQGVANIRDYQLTEELAGALLASGDWTLKARELESARFSYGDIVLTGRQLCFLYNRDVRPNSQKPATVEFAKGRHLRGMINALGPRYLNTETTMTEELFAAIIESSDAPDIIFSRKKSFLRTQFRHEKFQGSGYLLLHKYCTDVLQINPDDTDGIFSDELFESIMGNLTVNITLPHEVTLQKLQTAIIGEEFNLRGHIFANGGLQPKYEGKTILTLGQELCDGTKIAKDFHFSKDRYEALIEHYGDRWGSTLYFASIIFDKSPEEIAPLGIQQQLLSVHEFFRLLGQTNEAHLKFRSASILSNLPLSAHLSEKLKVRAVENERGYFLSGYFPSNTPTTSAELIKRLAAANFAQSSWHHSMTRFIFDSAACSALRTLSLEERKKSLIDFFVNQQIPPGKIQFHPEDTQIFDISSLLPETYPLFNDTLLKFDSSFSVPASILYDWLAFSEQDILDIRGKVIEKQQANQPDPLEQFYGLQKSEAAEELPSGAEFQSRFGDWIPEESRLLYRPKGSTESFLEMHLTKKSRFAALESEFIDENGERHVLSLDDDFFKENEGLLEFYSEQGSALTLERWFAFLNAYF